METPSTTAVEATAPATVETSSATTTAMEATASTTVTAVLGQRHIWCESQSCESRKRDKGFKQIKSVHNLSFPSTMAAYS
jgi:hypothetical protein